MATCIDTSSTSAALSKCNVGLQTSNDYFAFARINDEVYLVQGKYILVSLFYSLKSFSFAQFHVRPHYQR